MNKSVVRQALIGFLLLFPLVVTQAQVVRQLTDLKADRFGSAVIDDAGALVLASSSANAFGTNPDHAFQVVKWNVPVSGSAVTGLDTGVGTSVSVSDDGQWLTFTSPADPLGTNPDGSMELFRRSIDGTVLEQLTDGSGPSEGSVLFASLSGSGNRILFQATLDPLATNPDHRVQLFIMDADGSNLVQLTNVTEGSFSGASISDDGVRVTFSHDADLTGGNADGNAEVFRIQNDGTGLLQLTSTTSDDAIRPFIAGASLQIVFEQDFQIYSVSYNGSSPALVDAGSEPSITDNGKWVYYSNNTQIFKKFGTVGVATQLTFTSSPIWNYHPVVSGSDQRVVFRVNGGEHVGGNNPDGGVELMIMDSDGTNIQQLTENQGVLVSAWQPDITPDGNRIVFSGGPSSSYEVFRIQADGSDLTQITTDAKANSPNPQVSADGETIVFVSWEDLTGMNPCSGSQVYRIDADGTQLVQLTPDSPCQLHDHAVISGDGSTVVYQTSDRLHSVPATGGARTEVVSDANSFRKNPRIDYAGNWVVYHSESNVTGGNPDGTVEVFRARSDGSVLQQLTADPTYGSFRPDTTDDGAQAVYASSADPLGTNADHNLELFLYDSGTLLTQQLTYTTDGLNDQPRITGDGIYVYFSSSVPFFEANPVIEQQAFEYPSASSTEVFDIYRVTVASGLIERAAGLRDPRGVLFRHSLRNNPSHSPADNGRMALTGLLNATGGNLDLNSELWLVDFKAVPRFEISKTLPTELSWEPGPRAMRYDTIRGEVAQLDDGGGTVDLGSVTCIEEDSPDTKTPGDASGPNPGEAMFYLYRGSQGLLDTAASWGDGMTGLARVPGFGSCVMP